jgi:acyl-coenzyme A thioesterase PaaI-like protein
MGEFAVPEGFDPIVHSTNFGRLLGPFYEKSTHDGFVRAFRVDDRHVNALQIAHGGMLLTFADIVLGTAIFRAANIRAVTLHLVGDFVSPARLGDWIEGAAKVDRKTSSLFYASGRLSVRDKPVFSMSGVFHILKSAPDAGPPVQAPE